MGHLEPYHVAAEVDPDSELLSTLPVTVLRKRHSKFHDAIEPTVRTL
jgi:hypothetical protein